MSNIIFHNKFHRSTHHTVSAEGFPDSNLDPIASETYPFSGVFHTVFIQLTGQQDFELETFSKEPLFTFNDALLFLIYINYETGQIYSNSYDWYNVYNSVGLLSGEWGLYLPTYNTVIPNSGFWSSGYSSYQTLNELDLESLRVTYQANSAYWVNLKNAWLTNVAQEDTKAKNFAGLNVEFNSTSAYWDLSARQAAFITFPGTDSTYYMKNIVPVEQKKKGGKYYLVVQQSATGYQNIEFDTDFVFEAPYTSSNVIRLLPLAVTVIRFTCNGEKLYGKVSYFTFNGLKDITYFAGNGIKLSPNPADMFYDETLLPGFGTVVVFGPAPYSTSLTINIV